MKPFNRHAVVLAGLVTALGISQASADVIVGFSTSGGKHHSRESHHRPYHSNYYYTPHPYWVGRPYNHGWRRPYRSVVVAPLVVTQPAYMSAPASTSYGDYGKDLASLNERLGRLRAVVQRQKSSGQITPEAHDRYMAELDAIEHDQHARAYDRGGNLDSGDFAELFRRLDVVSEDVERDLAS